MKNILKSVFSRLLLIILMTVAFSYSSVQAYTCGETILEKDGQRVFLYGDYHQDIDARYAMDYCQSIDRNFHAVTKNMNKKMLVLVEEGFQASGEPAPELIAEYKKYYKNITSLSEHQAQETEVRNGWFLEYFVYLQNRLKKNKNVTIKPLDTRVCYDLCDMLTDVMNDDYEVDNDNNVLTTDKKLEKRYLSNLVQDVTFKDVFDATNQLDLYVSNSTGPIKGVFKRIKKGVDGDLENMKNSLKNRVMYDQPIVEQYRQARKKKRKEYKAIRDYYYFIEGGEQNLYDRILDANVLWELCNLDKAIDAVSVFLGAWHTDYIKDIMVNVLGWKEVSTSNYRGSDGNEYLSVDDIPAGVKPQPLDPSCFDKMTKIMKEISKPAEVDSGMNLMNLISTVIDAMVSGFWGIISFLCP